MSNLKLKIQKAFSKYNNFDDESKLSVDMQQMKKHIETTFTIADELGVLDNTLELKRLQVCEINKFDMKNFSFMVLDFGMPIGHLMYLCPQGLFSAKGHRRVREGYQKLNLWKDIEYDPKIIEWYKGKSRSLYQRDKIEVKIPKAKYLFLMQGYKTIKEHQIVHQDAFRFALETQTPIIFKGHPAHKRSHANHSPTCFKRMENAMGGKCEYVTYLDQDLSVDDVLDKVDGVFSADSAGSLNASLRGMKVATYYPNNFSEVIPIIERAEEMDSISAPNQEELKKYLTWYRDVLSIDITKPDYENRVYQRMKRFADGKSVEEILAL